MKNKSNKRIAFILGSMGSGGAERVISLLANHYSKKGYAVDILMLLADKCDYQLEQGIHLIPIVNESKSRMEQLPYWLYEIRKYAKQNKPDKIVSFVARINIVTMLACFGLNIPVIVSERNDPAADGRSKFVRIMTHLLYPLANKIVFQTKWAQSCFSEKIIKNSLIIRNPISVSMKASEIKENKIVTAGRLAKQKNHKLLISAFHRLVAEYPDYKLIIYGEGELRKDLTDFIHKKQLEKSVFLPGTTKALHNEIADAKMFVLSSDYEGLSNALLEAMMMGLPCISTDCAGSNEVIMDGENGLLVPIGAEEELFQAMKRFIADQVFATKIEKDALKSSESYKSEHVLKQWETLLD